MTNHSFNPAGVTVKNVEQFVNLMRRMRGKINAEASLVLRNHLNKLKQAQCHHGEEIAGSAMTARVFTGTMFFLSDLLILKDLRHICHHYGVNSGTHPPGVLLKADFKAMVFMACMNVAIHDVVLTYRGTATERGVSCHNIYARLNQRNDLARTAFSNSPIGKMVWKRLDALQAWVEGRGTMPAPLRYKGLHA